MVFKGIIICLFFYLTGTHTLIARLPCETKLQVTQTNRMYNINNELHRQCINF